MSYKVDPRDLIKAGAHFGHKTSRWNPKMSKYIYTKKDGVHILDITITADLLEQALDAVEKNAIAGKQILMVGTKRQAKPIIEKYAAETKSPYVVNRWPGGLLTNQQTMQKRIKKLRDLETSLATGELSAKYNKLEIQRFREEIESMNFLYGGVKDMNDLPGLMYVTDTNVDSLAIKEATRLGIPVIAIVDTNSDPKGVDYPLPANDDAIKTVEYITNRIAEAVENGKSKIKQKPHKEEK